MRGPPNEDVRLFSTRGIEGEYTAWNYVWSWDYGALVALGDLRVDNYGTVYISDWGPPDIYVRTFLGVGMTIANYDFNMWSIIDTRSATGKYVLGTSLVGTGTVFDVWRYGAIIFSRDIALDDVNATFMFPFAISPNGKFIAVITNRLLVPASMVMLYEGV